MTHQKSPFFDDFILPIKTTIHSGASTATLLIWHLSDASKLNESTPDNIYLKRKEAVG